FPLSRTPRPKPLLAVIVALSAIFILLLNRSQLPEAQLLSASHTLMAPTDIPGYAELKKRWQNNSLVETQITPKAELQTELPAKPRNLILVYLESVGTPVINHPDWPGLMPHLNELVAHHSIADDIYASSFITIEGIVNTQCGTLFPFDRGSDSLANGHNLGGNLPCLADVLEHAGYQNRYLGGAELAFAGKGKFLQAHGFQNPMGLSHWRQQGIKQRPGTWGISDPDIFAQALTQYQELSANDQPFNITLLTIGTHIPGFLYEECENYSASDDPFLNSLHCTDQLLHKWLQQLKALNVFDDTTVVITADHSVFSSPAMNRLFGDVIENRRVPLVVLGAEPPRAAVTGAGYDLAPTVLDLLDIKHNATFALGRSLLKPSTRPDYLLNRYTEVYDDQIHANANRQCNNPTPVPFSTGIPNACQRNDLFNLLRRQVESLSPVAANINCDNPEPIAISFPDSNKDSLSISLQEREISRYFSQEGRAIKRSSGLYLIWFDANGRLESTEYARAERAANELRTLPQSDITRSWVAIWVAPTDTNNITLPTWLDADPASNGVYLGYKKSQKIIWTAHIMQPKTKHWELDTEACLSALTTP
ncbi:LTA synthase family protein, partial [Gilvimarinus polysaccharolyticus]|uniref:LTA synthase family protein n=1 Tax=Gilvimarinus polysaccharolyticus TaxID=863921 RepID=UPI0018DC5938